MMWPVREMMNSSGVRPRLSHPLPRPQLPHQPGSQAQHFRLLRRGLQTSIRRTLTTSGGDQMSLLPEDIKYFTPWFLIISHNRDVWRPQIRVSCLPYLSDIWSLLLSNFPASSASTTELPQGLSLSQLREELLQTQFSPRAETQSAVNSAVAQPSVSAGSRVTIGLKSRGRGQFSPTPAVPTPSPSLQASNSVFSQPLTRRDAQ